MSGFFWYTITEDMKFVLNAFSQSELGQRFYLAGGTALALQLGHLSRAARKDFYDLYFVCQKISLKELLELASQKYPSVRDFEAQVVKRLVFFENAQNQVDPPLLQSVTWQTVKDYFTAKAKSIGQSWLQ